MTGETFDRRSNYLTLSGATAWWRGSVGVGLQTLSYSTNAANVREVALGEADLLTGGARAASELVATLGYAQEIGGIDWGVSAKTVEQRMGGSKDVTVAFDIGASVDLGDIKVGLGAQNLGPDLEVAGTSLELANRVTLGASFQRWSFGPLDLGASAHISRKADGTVIPALGGEIAWWPVIGRTFSGWIGVRRVEDGPADQLTFGAAFRGDSFSLEYAFQGFDGLDAAHRLGVAWR